jgi:hypothetical protein
LEAVEGKNFATSGPHVSNLIHVTNHKQTTRKGKQTNTYARNTKINEEKQNKNTNGNVQSVTTRKKKPKKKPSKSDSFRNMEVKISYTLEDGHISRNM